MSSNDWVAWPFRHVNELVRQGRTNRGANMQRILEEERDIDSLTVESLSAQARREIRDNLGSQALNTFMMNYEN